MQNYKVNYFSYPVIRLTILFISGILLQKFTSISLLQSIVAFCLLILVFMLTKKFNENYAKVVGILLVISIGNLVYAAYNDKVRFIDANKIQNSSALYYGEVESIDLHKDYEIAFKLKTSFYLLDNKKYNSNSIVICKVRDDKSHLDALYAALNPGNTIKIRGTFKEGQKVKNISDFDYNFYLKNKGISGIVICYQIQDISIINNNKSQILSVIHRVRIYLDQQITNLHNPQTAALLKGLLIADRSEITPEINEVFINSGIVHVLSVSGLHTAYIALIFYFLFGRFHLRTKIILIIVGLFLYLVITGSPSSVFRSVVMASIILISKPLGRTSNIINSISLSAFIILFLFPYELFEPSFQLSYAAIISLSIFTPFFNDYIDSRVQNKIVKKILLFFSVTIAAQIFTLPFILVYFHKISFIVFITNIFAIPITGAMIGTGFITLIFNPISVWLSLQFAAANNFFTLLLYKLLLLTVNPAYSFFTIDQFSVYDAALFFALLLSFWCCLKVFSNRIKKGISLILLIFTFYQLSLLDNINILGEGMLNIVMLDVGQGDSFFIRFPNGENALIDAGNTSQYYDSGSKVIIPFLKKNRIEKIDYAFVSHLDRDHFAGYLSLIEKGYINKILLNIRNNEDSLETSFIKFARKYKVKIQDVNKSKISFGKAVLYTLTKNYEDLNNSSTLIKLVYGKNSFLFTGDIEKRAEIDYIETYDYFLDSDVLKISHHGSATGTSLEFIQKVSPEYSLISAGLFNRYNHPDEEVLNRLKRTKILRTDLDGMQIFQSDGNSINIVNWK